MKKKPTKESLISRAEKLMAERMHMPEAKSGKLCIVHEIKKKGSTLPVVTMRAALFTGLPPCNMTMSEDTVVHWLKEKGQGSWMSDMPCELLQMEDELTKHAKGNVLIGGLGLGIVANMVAKKKSVKRIVVVENSKDVIKLVAKYLPANVEVVQEDINVYLASLEDIDIRYDRILLDTWQGTGEWCWQNEVVPMRRQIGSYLLPQRVLCWQELTMLNQVNMMLYRVADTAEKLLLRRGTCHYYAFRCAVRDEGMRVEPRIDLDNQSRDESIHAALRLEQQNRNDIGLQWMANQFLFTVGSQQWEQKFGKYWDEAWAVQSEAEKRLDEAQKKEDVA